MRTGLFWFTHDLRLHDHPALFRACMTVDRLICVYNHDLAWSQHANAMKEELGSARRRFLEESLTCLAKRLAEHGQSLLITQGKHYDRLDDLIEAYSPSDIFCSEQHGYYERQVWLTLQARHHSRRFHSVATHTLFDLDMLPFTLRDMPGGFNRFRQSLERQRPAAPMSAVTYLPPPLAEFASQSNELELASCADNQAQQRFCGGERNGLDHLAAFFESDYPAQYKETRNALSGWESSCKLSPWLANGSLSVRKVAAELARYEGKKIANDSTQWIYFELLWREYFQWYALRHGKALFRFSGVVDRKPLTSHYGERFAKWVQGATPFPIVNACMNELRETGFMSNRGRQIVASCLVNELSIDWRFGAAYFEKMLIDYDVAVNWGNWQYLAGVGAASVKVRHFNLEKQSRQFDPENIFITQWGGNKPPFVMDSVDAADWPVLQ